MILDKINRAYTFRFNNKLHIITLLQITTPFSNTKMIHNIFIYFFLVFNSFSPMRTFFHYRNFLFALKTSRPIRIAISSYLLLLYYIWVNDMRLSKLAMGPNLYFCSSHNVIFWLIHKSTHITYTTYITYIYIYKHFFCPLVIIRVRSVKTLRPIRHQIGPSTPAIPAKRTQR